MPRTNAASCPSRGERPEEHLFYLLEYSVLCHTLSMPDRSSTNRPRDINELAAALVNEAVSEDSPVPVDDGKDPNAVALGRKGGKKGGAARAAALTPERRREIAQKAVAARWANKNPA